MRVIIASGARRIYVATHEHDFGTSDTPMNDNRAAHAARLHVMPDAEALAREVAGEIRRIANDCIAARGRFDIVLAGGATPKLTYEQLRGAGTAFDKWHVWFGDERCLPVGHPDRNDTMARTALLDRAAIPPAQIHPMAAESGPEPAARAYMRELGAPRDFDIVLLGLGEDGHTASLFPGQDWGERAESPSAIAVRHAPKPPPERVSLSATRLSRSRHVFFLIAGNGKREAVARMQRGEAIPANAIRPASGVDVFVTQDAIG
jgi:6-phosphogluconolactonase